MVFAELLPSVNELFVWKPWFGDSWYAFNKTAALAFLSTLICVGIFLVGSAQARPGTGRDAERGRDGLRDGRGADRRRGDGRRRRSQVGAVPGHPVLLDLLHQHLVDVPGDLLPRHVATRHPVVPRDADLGDLHHRRDQAPGPKYFLNACFPPGVPWPLYFLVAPIEFISKFMLRPFSLAVRLFANMAAGHVLLALFAIMTNELIVVHASGWFQIPMGILPFAGLVAMVRLRVPGRAPAGLHLHHPHRCLRQRIAARRALSEARATHHQHRHDHPAPPASNN